MVFKSDVAGAGKTYRIQHLAAEKGLNHIPVAIYHNTNAALILESEGVREVYTGADGAAKQRDNSSALHVMLSPVCSENIDMLMFSFIVLGDLVDGHGRHFSPMHLHHPILLEFPALGTPDEQIDFERRMCFVNLLPHEICVFNRATLANPLASGLDPARIKQVSLDTDLEVVQQVCKWLRALATNNGKALNEPTDANGQPQGKFVSNSSAKYAGIPDIPAAECMAILDDFCPHVAGPDSEKVSICSLILTVNFIRCLSLNALNIMEKTQHGSDTKTLQTKTGKADILPQIVERLIEMSHSITARSLAKNSLLEDQVIALGLADQVLLACVCTACLCVCCLPVCAACLCVLLACVYCLPVCVLIKHCLSLSCPLIISLPASICLC